MTTLNEIKEKIEKELTGATVLVEEEQHHEHQAGKRLLIQVSHSGFKGKTLLEQHRMIYNILQHELKEEVHAITLKTSHQ